VPFSPLRCSARALLEARTSCFQCDAAGGSAGLRVRSSLRLGRRSRSKLRGQSSRSARSDRLRSSRYASVQAPPPTFHPLLCPHTLAVLTPRDCVHFLMILHAVLCTQGSIFIECCHEALTYGAHMALYHCITGGPQRCADHRLALCPHRWLCKGPAG